MNLAELQTRVAAAIMTPLNGSDVMARRTIDGKEMREEVDALIAPNDRLTAVERLEIYSRSYWFRILDSLRDDFPGLAAVLGTRAFYKMARAYLTECPSQSFTMRNLGSRLAEWLAKHPEYTGKSTDLAFDMARLEWAHIEALDAAESKPLGPEDLLEPGPDLKVSLQPHLGLLALQYPVDDFRIAVTHCEPEDHCAASNAVAGHKPRTMTRRFRRTKPEPVYVAVHRRDFSIYYRRLEREEFLVLEALRAGQSIGDALEAVASESERVEEWFANWSHLGWLCVSRGDTDA